MAEKLTAAHPLFDPASVYNQMRWPGCVEGKMFGYITFLWVCAQHEPELHPAPRERSAEELSRYACRLAGIDVAPRNGEEGPPFRVLDVWPAPATFLALDRTLTPERLPRGEVSL